MAQHPKNDEAAEIVGPWKPGMIGRPANFGIQSIWFACEPDDPRAQAMPAPDMRAAAMVVKMIEWLVPCGKPSRLSAFRWDLIQAQIIGGMTLANALIHAVIEVKESPYGRTD